jgi:hypothetical protein
MIASQGGDLFTQWPWDQYWKDAIRLPGGFIKAFTVVEDLVKLFIGYPLIANGIHRNRIQVVTNF